MNLQGTLDLPELRRGKTYGPLVVTLYSTLPVYNVDGDPTSGIKTPGVVYTGLTLGSKTVRGKFRVTNAAGEIYSGADIGTVTWSVVSAAAGTIQVLVDTTVTDPSNTAFPTDTTKLRWDVEEVDTSFSPTRVNALCGGIIPVASEVTYT